MKDNAAEGYGAHGAQSRVLNSDASVISGIYMQFTCYTLYAVRRHKHTYFLSVRETLH